MKFLLILDTSGGVSMIFLLPATNVLPTNSWVLSSLIIYPAMGNLFPLSGSFSSSQPGCRLAVPFYFGSKEETCDKPSQTQPKRHRQVFQLPAGILVLLQGRLQEVGEIRHPSDRQYRACVRQCGRQVFIPEDTSRSGHNVP